MVSAGSGAHNSIRITPLGAGQDVGRSCILVSIGGRCIMLDCGVHMGFKDSRQFPDFAQIGERGAINDVIDAVIISHFHLDHCGALPYFTEQYGYAGPVYMTHPTKAICPILLEDFRRLAMRKVGGAGKHDFTAGNIKSCMDKVTGVSLLQTVKVYDDMYITPFYAGHVLGAAMFHIRVGTQSLVYTGDYNMTPDRHLGAAWIHNVRPDVLITESTYGSFIRDSKRCRERDFLRRVHQCVSRGGKVLIPVFSLGRAQELCLLLDTYWEQMGLRVPIYFSAGMAERATEYYKLFVMWTTEGIRERFAESNPFQYRHIKPFVRETVDLQAPGPMVFFATPGMLHAGQSLEVFKLWCGSSQNLVIIPGYCVVGTVGSRLLSDAPGPQTVRIDNDVTLTVRCNVQHLSFSAHADAKGIMQLIRQCSPRHVVLVHGEPQCMKFLRQKVNQEIGVPCHMPENGATLEVPIRYAAEIPASLHALSCNSSGLVAPHLLERERISDAIVFKSGDGAGRLSVRTADELQHDEGVTRKAILFERRVAIDRNAGGDDVADADVVFVRALEIARRAAKVLTDAGSPAEAIVGGELDVHCGSVHVETCLEEGIVHLKWDQDCNDVGTAISVECDQVIAAISGPESELPLG